MDEAQKYEAHVKRLEEIYPRAMRNVYCGVSTPAGWYRIVELLLSHIHNHISYMRRRRLQVMLMNRAVMRGREAVLARVCKDTTREPSSWELERVDSIMKSGISALPEYVPHIEVHQIKEKFGGLRFYFDGGNDTVRGMVDMAEVWAGQSCEVCGAIGTTRSGGWIRTLCDEHAKKD